MIQTSNEEISAAGEPQSLAVRWLGMVPYTAALEVQHRLHAARVAGEEPDTLLLLEHPHVYTLGRNSDPGHILMSAEFLRAQGATVERNERGGEVTYHGPRQLVGYPIIMLQPHERSLRALVDRLEDCIIRTLAVYGIAGRREPGERGIWVGERKIASIGMALRRWVVLHGMALNVDPDLRYFGYINPCGHARLAMTSMALELGRAPAVTEVAETFAAQFAAVFARRPIQGSPAAGPRRIPAAHGTQWSDR